MDEATGLVTASRILGDQVGSTAPVFLAFLAVHVIAGLTAVITGAIAALARHPGGEKCQRRSAWDRWESPDARLACRARITARMISGVAIAAGPSQNARAGRRSHSGRCGPLST